MNTKIRRQEKVEPCSINKYLFLDDIKDSLSGWSAANNLDYIPTLYATSFNHHAEVYDITMIENGVETSMFELFEQFYLILIPEDKKIKIFLSSKEKSQKAGINGFDISGFMRKIKKFFMEHVTFIQGDYEEVVLYD